MIIICLVTSQAWASPSHGNTEFVNQCINGLHAKHSSLDPNLKWEINTSNPRKEEILKTLAQANNIKFSRHDLEEIEADDISIVVQKASRFHEADKRVIVEDSALHVEGAEIGTNIKWLHSELSQYVGRKAVWVSLLAYRDGDIVKVFRAEIRGVIIEKKNNHGGIEDYFEPEHAYKNQTPNLHAMLNLLSDQVYTVRAPITQWHGRWQASN